MRLEKGADRSVELLDLLCRSLGQEHAQSPTHWVDFLNPVSEGLGILDALELHTRTYSATPQQALWVLLAFDIMPYLGRTWGFWCQDEPILPQMPEDDLWFLPHQDPVNPNRLILPVEAILTWWLEQVEGPLDRLWGEYDDERRRSFDNWKSGRTTPAISKVMDWFGDGNQFSYKSSDEAHLSTTQLRSLLLWARAIEQSYKDLVGFLTPDVAPNEADPTRNKALQLVELFRWSHEVTLASHDPSVERERRKFSDSFPEWAKYTVFFAIIAQSNGELPPPEAVARIFSALFGGLPDNNELPDVFDDLKARFPKDWTIDTELVERRNSVLFKMNEIEEIWNSNHPKRQSLVAAGIADLSKLPGIIEFEADLAYLSALHALSSGNFDEARQHAEKALELCLTRSIGPVKLEIAKLNFSLAVAKDAFNRGTAERSFRILCKSVQSQDVYRWKVGEGPIDYSMRLAATDHAVWFWGEIVRPYEGVEVDAPLQEDSEIIRAYAALLFSGASEQEVRNFIKQFRGTLKRKLRNVRGDTFFTLTSKMVPDLVRVMRQMPTYLGTPIEPSELANSMAATHLKLVSLLPRDVLEARDYLKQTVLMLAADRNDVEMVKALVDRLVHDHMRDGINAQDALGRTALHSAAKAGADRCFEILLASGADPTLQTLSGMTPAIFAATFGRSTIFEMRLACTTYQMGSSELEEVHKLAQETAQNFKAMRKTYAMNGYKIAGRKGFQRIAALTLEALQG
jgi:hypothetical protein